MKGGCIKVGGKLSRVTLRKERKTKVLVEELGSCCAFWGFILEY